jgi:hypothetical protein
MSVRGSATTLKALAGSGNGPRCADIHLVITTASLGCSMLDSTLCDLVNLASLHFPLLV